MTFQDEANRRTFHTKPQKLLTDETTVRIGAWNPTPERMKAHLEREVEIACSNIKKLWAKGVKKITPDDMLCSTTTMTRALEVLHESGYNA